LTSLSFN